MLNAHHKSFIAPVSHQHHHINREVGKVQGHCTAGTQAVGSDFTFCVSRIPRPRSSTTAQRVPRTRSEVITKGTPVVFTLFTGASRVVLGINHNRWTIAAQAFTGQGISSLDEDIVTVSHFTSFFWNSMVIATLSAKERPRLWDSSICLQKERRLRRHRRRVQCSEDLTVQYLRDCIRERKLQ